MTDILPHRYLKSCRIARKLNALKGKQMTCEVAAYLLTSLCYYAFIMLMKNQEIETWLDLVVWTITFMISSTASIICVKVSDSRSAFVGIMTKTIQAALSPLLITGSLCCLCFFEYPLGRIRLYPSCLYFLSTWSLFVCLYYYLLIPNILFVIMSWPHIITVITSIVSMFVSLFRFQELKTCLRKLGIVDDTLEVLGIPKEYQHLYKWMIRMIIGWIIISCITNVLDFLMWNNSKIHFDIMSILIPFVVNHFIHVNNINALIWGTILRYTGSRFERINKHIRDLVEDTGERNASFFVNPCRKETTERRQKMWIIMHVHLQLSCISRELNKVFSMQMTLDMTCSFTILVEIFLYFYQSYVDENTNTFYYVMDNLIVYIWAVLFVVKLLVLNHICQIVCDKANETIATLCELSNDDSDDDMREQILQFILQINQRQIKFSCMGLFYLGNSFVYKFFTSIMNVVVIIVQMRTSGYGTHDEINPSANNKD